MTIIGWVLLVFGVLVAMVSIPAGNGFGGVLIGLALAFGGAAMVWRFLTWKIATPIAIVLLFIGAAVSPTPAEKPADAVTPLFAPSSTTQSTASGSAPSPRPTTSTSTITSTPSASSATPMPRATRPTTVTTTARPAPRTTRTPRPAPVYETPETTYQPPAYTPPANRGSNGRTGAICNDGTRDSRTGRGACSGHKGVMQWLY